MHQNGELIEELSKIGIKSALLTAEEGEKTCSCLARWQGVGQGLPSPRSVWTRALLTPNKNCSLFSRRETSGELV